MYSLALLLIIAAIILTIIDFLQSLALSSIPLSDYDHNTIYGRNPTPKQVCQFFALVLLLEVLLAVGLALHDQPVALCWVMGFISLFELASVRLNYVNGLPSSNRFGN